MPTVSRRQFLASVPAMTYIGTSVPAFSQDNLGHSQIRYGEYTKKGFQPYSWDKIRKIMRLRNASEEAFYQRMEERYAELTGAYNQTTGNGDLPDFAKVFGADQNNHFMPPSVKDLPKDILSYAIRMDPMDEARLRQIKKAYTFGSGAWSIGSARFADGARIITPYLLPIRRIEETLMSQDCLAISQYSNGTDLYFAQIVDRDDYDDQAPDEYTQMRKIEGALAERLVLDEITPEMIEYRYLMRQKLNELQNSDSVKKFLKDQEDARKLDGVPSLVMFSHPYEILTQGAKSLGLSESDLEDNTRYYFEFSGQGIFQRDVYEHIEMPGSSPLGIHARKWYNKPDPYRRVFRVADMPKRDADLLKKYYTEVVRRLKHLDDALVSLR